MRKLLTNFFYVFLAQGTVLALSICLNLILPKYIGKEEFGYWQYFLLLSSYVGFFTFGFNDGYYLMEGGKSKVELDHEKIQNQFYFFVLFQVLIGSILFCISFYLQGNTLLFQILSIYLVFQNISNYFGFVFQGSGQFKKYSFSVLSDKIFFIFSLFLLIFFRSNSYLLFILFYTGGKFVSTAYSFVNVRYSISLKKLNLKKGFNFWVKATTVGVSLMISNVVGSLIIGFGRLLIERKWGIKVFGEVSLSISFTFFFLLFVTQIGMVLFPMIKKIESQNMPAFFEKIKIRLDIVLPFILLLYYPAQFLLGLWLPKYLESLRFLILLLPICVYEGRFHTLYLVFFKALRKERRLLTINILAFILSASLCILSAYYFDNLVFLLISLVIAIIIRSLYSEYYLSDNKKIHINNFFEFLLIVVFIFLNWNLNKEIAFICFFFAFIVYYLLNLRSLKAVILKSTNIQNF